MGDMIKQPSPSPRAGAFCQLMIASVERLSRCWALWDGGRSSPQKSGKQSPQEAGGLAGGRDPHLEGFLCSDRKQTTHQYRH